MYFRTFLEKDAQINEREQRNQGLNRQATVSNSSRYLFDFGLDRLRFFYENCFLGDGSKVRHILNLYPNRLLSDTALLPSSINFCLLQVNESWVEGCGYTDDDCNSGLCYGFRFIDACSSFDSATWETPKTGGEWLDIESSGATYSIIDCLDYQCSDKVLQFDVTEHVQRRMFTTGETHGYALATFDDDVSLTFHTRESFNLFQPHLDTIYDNPVIDDRGEFYLGKENNLYLFSNAKKTNITLDRPPNIHILDYDENIIASGTTECISQGIYKAKITLDDGDIDECGSYTDLWTDLYYNGKKLKDVEQTFLIKSYEDYYSFEDNSSYQHPRMVFSGIRYNERILQGDVKRVQVKLYEARTTKLSNYDLVLYRIYVKQGNEEISIQDWQIMNKSQCSNWIDLYTESYLPQKYCIQFKTIIGSSEFTNLQELTFHVIASKKQ